MTLVTLMTLMTILAQEGFYEPHKSLPPRSAIEWVAFVTLVAGEKEHTKLYIFAV